MLEDERCAEVIRSLRKDEGLTVEKIAALSEEERLAVNKYRGLAMTPEQMFDLIRLTALNMADDQYARAIRNALAIGTGMAQANLTERRMRLLEYMDVSLRTLIKYEDIGADIMARDMIDTDIARMKADTMDTASLGIQLVRLREIVDRAGIDADLPLKISEIKSEISQVQRRLDAVEQNITTLWEKVFPQPKPFDFGGFPGGLLGDPNG